MLNMISVQIICPTKYGAPVRSAGCELKVWMKSMKNLVLETSMESRFLNLTVDPVVKIDLNL